MDDEYSENDEPSIYIDNLYFNGVCPWGELGDTIYNLDVHDIPYIHDIRNSYIITDEQKSLLIQILKDYITSQDVIRIRIEPITTDLIDETKIMTPREAYEFAGWNDAAYITATYGVSFNNDDGFSYEMCKWCGYYVFIAGTHDRNIRDHLGYYNDIEDYDWH